MYSNKYSHNWKTKCLQKFNVVIKKCRIRCWFRIRCKIIRKFKQKSYRPKPLVPVHSNKSQKLDFCIYFCWLLLSHELPFCYSQFYQTSQKSRYSNSSVIFLPPLFFNTDITSPDIVDLDNFCAVMYFVVWFVEISSLQCSCIY